MGFLDVFKGSPLKRLEAEAEENPSSETFLALAQKHIELGEMGQALEVADRGLQKFKNSPKLKDIVVFVKKKRSQDQVKHLRDEIRVKPSPSVYTQLADIYRDLGDMDQALDLLMECAEKFPEDATAFRIVGQIRLENFLQEVIAYDGIHAWKALRKARELTPDDSNARLLLSQLHFAVGANALAVQAMKEELKQNPTALDIKSFLEDIGNPSPTPDGVTIEALIERCEESGSLTNSLKGYPRVKPGIAQRTVSSPKINTVAAAGIVHETGALPGVKDLVILDREGKTVASVRGAADPQTEAFREMACAVQQVANEGCRRMDIGSFVKGGIYFGGGGVVFVRRRGTTFTLSFGDPLKHDRAATLLEELVQKVVGGGGA